MYERSSGSPDSGFETRCSGASCAVTVPTGEVTRKRLRGSRICGCSHKSRPAIHRVAAQSRVSLNDGLVITKEVEGMDEHFGGGLTSLRPRTVDQR